MHRVKYVKSKKIIYQIRAWMAPERWSWQWHLISCLLVRNTELQVACLELPACPECLFQGYRGILGFLTSWESKVCIWNQMLLQNWALFGVTWAQVGSAPCYHAPAAHMKGLKSWVWSSWLGPGQRGPSLPVLCLPVLRVGLVPTGILVDLVTMLQWLEDRETTGCSVTPEECRLGWDCLAQKVLEALWQIQHKLTQIYLFFPIKGDRRGRGRGARSAALSTEESF